MPEVVPPTTSSPDSPYRNLLFIELGAGGVKMRMGFTVGMYGPLKAMNIINYTAVRA